MVEGCACFAYAALLATLWRRQRTALHTVFVLALWAKSLNLLVQAEDKSADSAGRATATALRFVPAIVSNCSDIVDLVTYLITALGWKQMRSRLYAGEAAAHTEQQLALRHT